MSRTEEALDRHPLLRLRAPHRHGTHPETFGVFNCFTTCPWSQQQALLGEFRITQQGVCAILGPAGAATKSSTDRYCLRESRFLDPSKELRSFLGSGSFCALCKPPSVHSLCFCVLCLSLIVNKYALDSFVTLHRGKWRRGCRALIVSPMPQFRNTTNEE
jgi:hypothetical protein